MSKPDSKELKNMRIAILTEDGVDRSELTGSKKALEKAGAKVDVVSPRAGKVKTWDKKDWGKKIEIDRTFDNVHPAEYDAIVLPGGVMNPDKLRQSDEAVNFIRDFMQTGKPVAAICHGSQTLIETGILSGRTMTSYPGLQTDLRNAGVNWVDREMVHEGNLITSRTTDDLDAFNKELIDTLAPQKAPGDIKKSTEDINIL